MASTATGVTATEGGWNTSAGSFTADPASVASLGIELVTVTIPGLRAGDVPNVVPRSALLTGLVIAWARVSADNTMVFAIVNVTAGALDQASTVFDYGVIRGSTQSLR